VPCCALIDDSIVIAFISSASSWTATKGITHILLFNGIQQLIILRPRQGRDGGRCSSLTTLAAGGTSLIGSCHSGMERREVTHHLVVLLLLIRMNSLSMLAEVVKTRELFPAMTSEGTFTSVFPVSCYKREAQKVI
jgi:hypothetical protein